MIDFSTVINVHPFPACRSNVEKSGFSPLEMSGLGPSVSVLEADMDDRGTLTMSGNRAQFHR